MTKTKYETQNTMFNETFVFENVMLSSKEWGCEKVGLILWDRNNFLTNTKIGGIEFSLDNIYRQKQHEYFRKWVPMTLPNAPGKEHGFLHISIHVLKRGDEAPSLDAKETLQGEVSENSLVLSDPKIERKVFLLNCLIYRGEDIKVCVIFRF